jgi:transcription antitermination factor NusG
MSQITYNHNDYNKWLDHYFYGIEVNVIPANSKEKRPIISYTEYLNNSILPETFETWKKEGKFKDGFIIILGRIWRGEYEGYYLIGIDLDSKSSIEKFCSRNGKITTLKKMSEKTVVEQHKDDLTRAHIYFISLIPFPIKSSDSISHIEVKHLMVPAPNIHKNGHLYEIIGNKKEPIILNEKQALELIRHIDSICRQYGQIYIDSTKNNKITSQIKKMIKSLFINDKIVIEEGVRHLTLLSIADSLLINHVKSRILKEDEKMKKIEQLKNVFFKINNELSKPIPVPEKEINEIWNSAINYVDTLEIPQINSSTIDNKQSITEKASEYLLIKFRFLTLETTKEIFYYENGAYKSGGEIIIEKELEKEYGYELKISILNEVKGHISRRTFVKSEDFDKDVNIINLKMDYIILKKIN